MNRRSIASAALAAITAVTAAAAGAQQYPQRPIRWLSPFAPGGGADTTTRAVAQKVSEYLGQPVVVDSRTGASGKIAVDLAARAPADGYALITITPSMVSNQAIGDFMPITQMTAQFYVLVVNPSVPAASVKELIALAHAKPGTLHYGSAGVETMQHLAGASLGAMTGTSLTHVPYKGGALALTDLIGGQIQMLFAAVPTALPQIKSGKVRALAVTATKRSPVTPDLPTVAEAGVPGYEAVSYYGFFAPAGVPAEPLARLRSACAKVIADPAVGRRLEEQGIVRLGLNPEEFAAYVAADRLRWGRVIREANITVN